MIVDAHLHVWDLGRASYPWLGPAHGPINRDIDISEVRPALDRLGVARVVLVQSADNLADTVAMLDVARLNPDLVAGVVGWVPLDAPRAIPDMLERHRRSGRLVGVRSLIHDRPDPEWIVRPAPDEGLGYLEQLDVPFDFVTSGPDPLALIPGIVERHPALRLVIDHLGKPPVGGTREERARWRRLISRAAESPTVHAKVSGLYPTSGDPAAWSAVDVRPFVEDALEIFGAARLMFGGDWPISILAGGYERVSGALLDLIGELPEGERRNVLAGTATDVYRLSDGSGTAARDTGDAAEGST